MGNIKNLSIKISGKVQGVFFRASTKEKADELRVTGFVKNEHDGSVYIEAEGDENNLRKFIDWCQKGPPNAKVNNVSIEESSVQNFTKFEVRR